MDDKLSTKQEILFNVLSNHKSGLNHEGLKEELDWDQEELTKILNEMAENVRNLSGE
jgi:hypothetical protein